MNSELEIQFIQMLKCGLLDKLAFTENRSGRITGFRFSYNISGCELTEKSSFREEGDELILIIPFYTPAYHWGRYINFRRGIPERDDILKVNYGVISDEKGINVECRLDLRSLSPRNIGRFLCDLNHEIWDSSSPIVVDENNYTDIDWDRVVAYVIDHPRLTMLDDCGNPYEYRLRSNSIIDGYLDKFLGEAFHVLNLPRGVHHWPDKWHTYKRSNGHCLYIREEYSERLPNYLVENYRAPKVYYEILTRIVDMVLDDLKG